MLQTDRTDRQRSDSIGRTACWTTVRKTVRPVLSDRCPVCPVLSVCLSVTLVYSAQTVGWIKMKLGMEAGLAPGHVVLDGDPALRPPKVAQQPPHFLGPCVLWPNGRPSQLLLSSCTNGGPELLPI